jgi:hypothetical protein
MRRPKLAALIVSAFVSAPFAGCSDAGSPPASDEQGDPRAVVEAFSKAMEKADLKTMERLMEPGRLQKLKEGRGLEAWMDIWKKHKVLEVGDVLTAKDAGGALPDSVQVRVEYERPGGEKFVDSVKVRRVEQLWYWDEN